jgi:hypothetical protein
MNKEQLKELVKAHFNLVEYKSEKFGELYDENKAFKIVFPGATLKVGDEVKVVTAEGQETLAPDGYHKLEDGTMIKTEGSTVTELTTSDTEVKEDEMAANSGLGAVEGEEDAAVMVGFAGPKADISNVEGTSPQNATTVTDATVATLTGPVDTVADVEARLMGKMKMAIDEAVASAINGVKEEMKSMKAKFDEYAASPATEKTMAAKAKTEKFSTTTSNDAQIKVMRELMKNKNK